MPASETRGATDLARKQTLDKIAMNYTELIKEELLDKQDAPVVFKGMIHTWPASGWTPEALSQLLGDQKLKFRIGKKRHHGIQWETECPYTEASVQDFVNWVQGKLSENNPLINYSKQEHWCYADYKYMSELCQDKPIMLEGVDWSTFGFLGRGGEESTFWLGSAGAHTVCHRDSYGCNLVAQIHGRKKWVLFPPADTTNLYPTRVPYEESSVFSQVHVPDPDRNKHPLFTESRPHVVVLEPGQVLFVPRHWWHYVESVDDTTISINTWIELDVDKEERVREAVVRTLTFALMSNPQPHLDQSQWLNPTENYTDHAVNLSYLQASLQDLRQSKTLLSETKQIDDNTLGKAGEVLPSSPQEISDTDTEASGPKRRKQSMPSERANRGDCDGTSQRERDGVSISAKSFISDDFEYKHIQRIEPVPSCDFLRTVTSTMSANQDAETYQNESQMDLTTSDLTQCITHPDVIKLVTEKVLQMYT